MVNAQSELDECLAKLPSPAKIKKRIEETLEKTSLLRQLLRLSEQREKVREAESK